VAEDEDSIAVVDDATMLVVAVDPLDVSDKMTDLMGREDEGWRWSKTHDCQYAPKKFGWMIFTRRREKD
jgi:hypothetical protein